MLRILVCVSGGGTNLQAIIDGIANGTITNTEIVRVISNNKKAYALERAKNAGIDAACVSPKDYADREQFNEAFLQAVTEAEPDLIVLAGFLVVIPEKMIKALSSLFRYNLKSDQVEVPLARELKVVEDYMYLQQMRFGERIAYDVKCDVNREKVLVPAYTFQPLVENAIIHGLSKKEEGGVVRIRVGMRGGAVHIYIGDTGKGMTGEELEELRLRLCGEEQIGQGKQALQEVGQTGQGKYPAQVKLQTGQRKRSAQAESHLGQEKYSLRAGEQSETTEKKRRIGIGMGNIYRRIIAMYPKGSMEIYSKHLAGTVIKLVIPQKNTE